MIHDTKSPEPRTPLNALHAALRGFMLATSFLTCLAPARAASGADMAKAVRWYPLVGLLVGSVCVLPPALGIGAGHPFVQAWLYVLVNLMVTRGLHWDGISDFMDAWGSSATGEKFWNILKDSRIGAFGVMGIVLGMTGQLFAAASLLQGSDFTALIAAPIVGRSACIVLAALVPPGERSTLGRLTHAGADRVTVGMALGMGTCALLLSGGIGTLLFAVAGCSGAVFWLASLGKREQGLNGDFLGSGIVICETITLFAAL